MENNIISQKINYIQTVDILNNHDNFLILCHQDPDGDTIGSAFSLYYILKQLNKTAKIRCNNSFSQKYSYFTKDYTESEINGNEYIISVDVADNYLLGEKLEQYKTKVDLAIDHHYSHRDFAKKLLVEDNASATALVIFNLAKNLNVNFTQKIANSIYTGIATDTGCFKFSNTTPQAHLAAAELIMHGCDYAKINRTMFETKSKARFELEKLVFENLEFFANGKGALIKITNEMLSSTGTDSSDIEIGIALKEKLNEETGAITLKASVRTNESVDAAEICGIFGGGGHKRAAGCSFNCTLDQAAEKIITACEKFL
ncbi:MAG: bifunctional oligoribonuclease/PAP phosphatase NrnA [Oscillospiraceae bacterium]